MSLYARIYQAKIQKWAFFITFLAILITFIQMFSKAYRPQGYDFTSYLLASKAFFHGENPYTLAIHFPYIYPLFSCIALAPLTWLPYGLANALWFALNIASLFFALCSIQTYLLPPSSVRQKMLLSSFVFLLLYPIARNHLLNGQINFMVLGLCSLFFIAHLEKRVMLASFALAVAIVTKLTPLIFLLYLLREKNYQTVVLTIIFTLFLSVICPILCIGSMKTALFYQSFFMTVQYNALTFHSHHILLSLYGILPFYIALLLSIVLLISLFLAQRYFISSVTVFSIYLLLALLINPMSETHHLANVFIPVLVMLHYHVYCDSSKIEKVLFGGVICLVWLSKLVVVGFILAIALLIILVIRQDRSLARRIFPDPFYH